MKNGKTEDMDRRTETHEAISTKRGPSPPPSFSSCSPPTTDSHPSLSYPIPGPTLSSSSVSLYAPHRKSRSMRQLRFMNDTNSRRNMTMIGNRKSEEKEQTPTRPATNSTTCLIPPSPCPSYSSSTYAPPSSGSSG